MQRPHWLEPQAWFRFIHLRGFTADWKRLRLTDDDLRSLQIQIIMSPTGGQVVQGTGGLRKLRFAPPEWRRGKRGATRVLYAIFPEHSVAVLAAAYAKNERAEISPTEKTSLRSILRQIEDELARHP